MGQSTIILKDGRFKSGVRNTGHDTHRLHLFFLDQKMKRYLGCLGNSPRHRWIWPDECVLRPAVFVYGCKAYVGRQNASQRRKHEPNIPSHE